MITMIVVGAAGIWSAIVIYGLLPALSRMLTLWFARRLPPEMVEHYSQEWLLEIEGIREHASRFLNAVALGLSVLDIHAMAEEPGRPLVADSPSRRVWLFRAVKAAVVAANEALAERALRRPARTFAVSIALGTLFGYPLVVGVMWRFGGLASLIADVLLGYAIVATARRVTAATDRAALKARAAETTPLASQKTPLRRSGTRKGSLPEGGDC